jgi:hypothetical protein
VKILLLFALAAAGSAQEDSNQVLSKIKERVADQLSKTVNYACTETLARTYFRPLGAISPACGTMPAPGDRKQFARDQLRLDVAVSKEELYSWHGENNFSAKRISDIVETGPISSGGFVGYLQNIFLAQGIHFTYNGILSSNRVQQHAFTFEVPKGASQYSVSTGAKYQVVPFHGLFTARVDNFELLSLKVIPDEIPFGSNICSVQTEIFYQLASISGRSALIPDSFELVIDDDQHEYTVSRAQYRNCHEFRAESTLHFDYSDSPATAGPASAAAQSMLPSGIKMRLALSTPLSDESSYAGDSVSAVLLEPIKIPGAEGTIPRGVQVRGVITRFEERLEPSDQYFLKIVFQRITDGNRTYVFNAVHKPAGKEMDKIASLWGGFLPKQIMFELTQGTMIIPGKHLRLDERFKGEWETSAIVAKPGADASKGR